VIALCAGDGYRIVSGKMPVQRPGRCLVTLRLKPQLPGLFLSIMSTNQRKEKTMYVYIKSESASILNIPGASDLYTVGFYNHDGSWESESDHSTAEKAAERVHWLNGGGGIEINANLIEAAPELFAQLEWIVSKARLVPCKDGGKDATHQEVNEGKAMASGKWRVESSVDGWIVEARRVLAKAKGQS
jgi:hypothetical protein